MPCQFISTGGKTDGEMLAEATIITCYAGMTVESLPVPSSNSIPMTILPRLSKALFPRINIPLCWDDDEGNERFNQLS